MCIRDRGEEADISACIQAVRAGRRVLLQLVGQPYLDAAGVKYGMLYHTPVSYTHLRAHETVLDLVCRLLLEKKNNKTTNSSDYSH